jgi:transposase
MLKAFKYRLYSGKGSSVLLNERFGCARWVYNYGLHSKTEAYNNDGVWTCHKCQAKHDRDILTARNILKYCFQKQYKIGQRLPESTLTEKATPSLI